MNYRSEIDGLRALALLPVILFHADIQTFRGGFVGVDVFFVISGYLITSIILTEQRAGTFSLMSFYERRARRILPALFVVTFACVLFAWLWMLPEAMKDFAKSVAAVCTFTSNLFFWRESGYFAPSNQLRPLLHTWSLAVEEQYYLTFPIFLLLAWRMGKRSLLSLLIAVSIVSLAGAQWGAFHMPGTAFYFLPTRGWELMIGVFVAFYLVDKENCNRESHALYQFASLVGILLIAYAVFVFEQLTPWPSLYTLVPTLGTALVIVFAREQTLAHRLLGSRVLVGIGLISYSAYLWHYPLFAFARIRSIDAPSQATLLALAFIAIIFAYISWRYVEQPIRSRHLFERSTVFVTSAIGGATLLLIGLGGYITSGFPARWDPTVLRLSSANAYHRTQLYAEGCHLKGSDHTLKNCVRGISTQVPAFAIWGDSHAGVLVHELEESFIEEGLSFLQYTKNNCPVSLGLHTKLHKGEDEHCEQFTESTMRDLVDKNIETVIIASRWLQYVDEDIVKASTNRNDLYTQAPTDTEKVWASYAEAIRGLLRNVRKVILVYPVPESERDVPTSLVKLLITNDLQPFSLAASYGRVSQRLRKAGEIFDSIGMYPQLLRIRPEELFCNTYKKGICVSQLDGVPLYFDNEHLSNAGARLIVDKIVKEIFS